MPEKNPDNARLLRLLERLIDEVSDGLDTGQLTKRDVKQLIEKQNQLGIRLGIMRHDDYASGISKSNPLGAARFVELKALLMIANTDDRWNLYERVAECIDASHGYLPHKKEFISDRAKEIYAGFYEPGYKKIEKVSQYKQRKMTVNEHVQSLGDHTPGEVGQTIVYYVVVGAILIIGLYAWSQN